MLVCLGWGLFLTVNVFFLWGVPLPLSTEMTLAVYDALIEPYRVSASMSITLAVFVVFLMFRNRPPHFICAEWVMWGSLAMLFAGYAVFVLVSAVSPVSWAFCISGIFIGISNGLLFLFWGELLSVLDFQSTVFALFGAGAISGLACIGLVLLPELVSYGVVGVILPITAWLLWLCRQRLLRERAVSADDFTLPDSDSLLSGHDAQPDFRSFAIDIARPLFCVMILGLIFNSIREIAFADFGSPSVVNLFSLGGLLVVSCLFLVLALRFSIDPPTIDQIYTPLVLVISAALVPVPFTPVAYRMVFIVLISCSYLPAITIIKATCAHLANKHSVHPFAAFGFVYFGAFTAVGMGTAVGCLPRMTETFDSFLFVVGIVLAMLYLLMVSLAALRSNKNRKGNKQDAPTSTVVISMNDDELKRRCEQLAESCGVTKSELPVMEMLARRMTFSAISKELLLSENTVRSHGKAVYRKLGVHSKDELVAVVTGKAEPR